MSSASRPLVNFLFLRLDRSFRALQSNEKVVAEDEFLNAYESYHKRFNTLVYSLTGLRADCDLLLVRTGSELESFQEMSARLLSAGVGKHLTTTHSYLALAPTADALGPGPRAKYLFLHPYSLTPAWAALAASDRARAEDARRQALARVPSVRPLTLVSAGLDDNQYLSVLESDSPDEVGALAVELAAGPWGALVLPGSPTFTCVARDARDLLAGLG